MVVSAQRRQTIHHLNLDYMIYLFILFMISSETLIMFIMRKLNNPNPELS